MSWLALGLGLVLVIEGLVLALAPHLLDRALRLMLSLPVEARRLAGLAAVATGAALVALARMIGG